MPGGSKSKTSKVEVADRQTGCNVDEESESLSSDDADYTATSVEESDGAYDQYDFATVELTLGKFFLNTLLSC